MELGLVMFITIQIGLSIPLILGSTEKKVDIEITHICGQVSLSPLSLSGLQKGDFPLGSQLWKCPEDIRLSARDSKYELIGCIKGENDKELVPLITDRAPLSPVPDPFGSRNLLYLSRGEILQEWIQLLEEKTCIGHLEELNQQVVEQAGEGNVTALKSLLDQGADVDFKLKDGRSSLVVAAWGGHLKTVEFLMAKGANVHSVTNSGHSALHAAAQIGALGVAKALADGGAHINGQADDGQTPFYVACTFQRIIMADFLRGQGADPFIRDARGNVALHGVAARGHLDVIQYLVESIGMDVNMINMHNHTALALASTVGCTPCVQYLLENGANLRGASDQNALYMAAATGHLAIMQFLLEAGLRVEESMDSRGLTPLHAAVIGNHLKVVEFLISVNKTLVNQADGHGLTALRLAASYGEFAITKALVEAGADVNLDHPLQVALRDGNTQVGLYLMEQGADINGDSNEKVLPALHAAAHSGDVMAIERLIILGADVNARALPRNETALFWAVASGKAKAVRTLLRNGADPELRNSDGLTILFDAVVYPKILIFIMRRAKFDVNQYSRLHDATLLVLAVDKAVFKTVKYLLTQTSAQVNPTQGRVPLLESAKLDMAKFPQILLENGANVSAVNSKGMTALHIGSMSGFFTTVEALLEFQAPPNVRTSFEGATPLLLATRNGHGLVVSSLLAHGADPKIGTNDFTTPLHLATRFGHLSIVQALIAHGADVKAKDDDRKTPLDLALAHNQGDISSYTLCLCDTENCNPGAATPAIQPALLGLSLVFLATLSVHEYIS
eukprot:maker-scaffold831_size90909-snap-gene-0.17 protein:Tk01585 transcript:maker-scaffold831_size90909-snap-gene-0.17-mRNA-1 annotation:"inversin protein alternative isoform"